MDKIKNIVMGFMPLIRLLLILLFGFITIKIIIKVIKKALGCSKLQPGFAEFLVKVIRIFMYILLVLTALSSIGVSTTGILAALSASVVAVAVALKDSLSNVAGGILLLISPRFTLDEYIQVGTDSGSVVSIDLLHTTIKTPDNKQISIPNGILINSHITNYSAESKRRVDITCNVAYGCDVNLAIECAKKVILAHPLTENEPAEPLVRVMSYDSSSIGIVLRVWCNSQSYWDLYFDLIEQVKKAFDENGISIPYNQLDVHIKKEE